MIYGHCLGWPYAVFINDGSLLGYKRYSCCQCLASIAQYRSLFNHSRFAITTVGTWHPQTPLHKLISTVFHRIWLWCLYKITIYRQHSLLNGTGMFLTGLGNVINIKSIVSTCTYIGWLWSQDCRRISFFPYWWVDCYN